MEPGLVKIRRYVVRPIVYIWIAVVPVMVTLVLLDVCLPAGASPLARIFQYRENIDCPEWKAMERAESMVPSSCKILIETDTRHFYLLLRYRLYPTWVLRECDLSTCTSNFQNDEFELVSYYEGSLQVVEADLP